MWKNIVERGRPQMTIWHMRIACWIPKATNTQTHTDPHTHTRTHSEYVILIAFPLQQWLHERASMLRHTYIVCHVIPVFVPEELAFLSTLYRQNHSKIQLKGFN